MEDRVVLVTGGGSGIGAAIARSFDAEGARVAVLDLDPDAAHRIADELAQGLAVPCDVTDRAAVDTAVDDVARHWGGRLDVLVNNAGAVGREEADRLTPRMEAQRAETATGRVTTALDAALDLTDDQWRRMLASHLDGTFYCTRAALRVMSPAGSGVIVNMASICGLVGCAGAPHYSAAKAGVLGFTRAVAKDVIRRGIRVNAVAPGYVDTPFLDVQTPAFRAAQALAKPIGRLGTPAEVAAAVVFLASDDASFFVGETLSPNGGLVTI
jgi:3-oxoacyl-[acyl-carrier protein] reductase